MSHLSTGDCAFLAARILPFRSRDVHKILYVGDTFDGSTSGMRLATLRRLGFWVQAVSRPHPAERGVVRSFSRAMARLGYPKDHGVNESVLRALVGESFDMLWCDRPLDLRPETLRAAKCSHPAMRMVAYSVDDMFQAHNQSAFYVASIPLYDLHVTTKSYNVHELAGAGAQRVVFVNNAFSPQVHFPIEMSGRLREEYGGPVGFVGTYERERAEILMALAREGVPVRVWGGSWPTRLRGAVAGLRIEGRDLMGDPYRYALNSFDICLGFLRKINRDLQTTRSVEIPACGAFLLAERTTEHRALFQEDVEAAYFSSTQELISKVKYYLGNPSARKRIAADGFRRAVCSYSYEEQLRSVLAQL